MTSATLNNISLKYQRFTSFGCRYIGIRKLVFVAKTQFLLSLENFFCSTFVLGFIFDKLGHQALPAH